MPFDDDRLKSWLRGFAFADLFRLGLGWDNISRTLDVTVAEQTYKLTAIAQKRGYMAWLCDSIPDRATRLKIDHKVTKSSQEHFIVYADRAAGRQIWQWVRRQPGQPIACRERQYAATQSGERLVQALKAIQFRLDQEESLSLPDVIDVVEQAFKAERITRRFYDRFKAEHAKFRTFVSGIPDDGDLSWYTSLTLNRLMFVYFIQKKGFLDGNVNYLRDRLEKVRDSRGKDRFQSFYRYFLLRLFHDGLGKTKADRKLDATLGTLLGDVPYLNGGFFEVHQLEKDNKDIDIPDDAFVALFDFFDQYQWHLDDRPLREDNEINPDVIGYIFEKYINQKQMGAYYTKEDITEYICKNTIIPFLFDAAKTRCAIAFEKDGALWRLLRNDPDRYIYPAVRHGVIGADGAVIPLPKTIAAGVVDVSKRGGWNERASDPYALPTETWREHVARRERCLSVREKLLSGEIHEIQDVVTHNLDIWQLARDAIVNAEGPEMLRAFWQAIGSVTVLDPTCGSGAFLFAALRILESLYGDCVERMEQFLDEQAASRGSDDRYKDFKEVLYQIEKHPNERYFFLKSIILANLYGVDIMEEAIEICKLRLFLKLVAEVDTAERIEPLPDIDFNIQAGNTLVGFASLEQLKAARMGKLGFDDDEIAEIEEQSDIVDRAFKQFRLQQIKHGGRVTRDDKEELRKRLATLTTELDKYLAADYGVTVSKRGDLAAWKQSHKPFHWFVEFYGIMRSGGFDVIVGNPPYLEVRQIAYRPKGFVTESSGAVHAMCMERSVQLLRNLGAMSMIVPLALVCTQRMVMVQQILETASLTWYANFAWRPGKLFDAVNRALTIFIMQRRSGEPRVFATPYQKWHSEARSSLVPTIAYTESAMLRPSFWVPKLSGSVDATILRKLLASTQRVADYVGGSSFPIYYRTTGGLYWKVFTDFAPSFKCNGQPGHSSRETRVFIHDKKRVIPLIALLSSNLFWWWYTITSNLRDLNPSDIHSFPVPDAAIDDAALGRLGSTYLSDIVANSRTLVRRQRQTGTTETQSFVIRKSKAIIDQIDAAIARHFGATPEELEYIQNYDIKFRLGFGDDDDDEEG